MIFLLVPLFPSELSLQRKQQLLFELNTLFHDGVELLHGSNHFSNHCSTARLMCFHLSVAEAFHSNIHLYHQTGNYNARQKSDRNTIHFILLNRF